MMQATPVYQFRACDYHKKTIKRLDFVREQVRVNNSMHRMNPEQILEMELLRMRQAKR